MSDIEFVLTHPLFAGLVREDRPSTRTLGAVIQTFDLMGGRKGVSKAHSIGKSADFREAFRQARQWLQENEK